MPNLVRFFGYVVQGTALVAVCCAVGLGGERSPSAASKFQKLALSGFDANHDGILDATEKIALNRALSEDEAESSELGKQTLAQFDGNRNGVLDRNEVRTAVRSVSSTPLTASLNSSKIQATRPTEQPQRTPAMLPSRGSFLLRFDTNGDGMLDQSEMAAAESALQQLFQQAQSASRGMPFAAGAGNSTNGGPPSAMNPLMEGMNGAAGCRSEGSDSGTTTTDSSTTTSSTNASRGFGAQRAGGRSGGFGGGAGGPRGFGGGGALGGRRGK